MTLVTGGESPKHSKWHLLTGSVLLLGVFVVTMFAIERHLGIESPSPSGSVSHADAPTPAPSDPTPIRIASRD